MEFQLFMWTGKIIWWALCSTVVLCAVAGAVIAPIAAYKKVLGHLWHWKLAGELAKSGFTEDDIRFAANIPGGLPCKYTEFIEAVNRIKERGRVSKIRR